MTPSQGLAFVIFTYAGLSLAQWRHATRWLHDSSDVLWCGNIVSDPYLLLVNIAAPFAAVCWASLAGVCIRSRRWSAISIAALLVFPAASVGLVSEGILLQREHGIIISRGIWWWPGG